MNNKVLTQFGYSISLYDFLVGLNDATKKSIYRYFKSIGGLVQSSGMYNEQVNTCRATTIEIF